ncbi:MAG: YfcE family phosphodiesterase [Anaerolineales bacterium]|nr:YfcE family phosphodiesterase [Anaerolineales bacterium]
MILGLLSDTHDNLNNLLKAIEIFKAERAETLIHCGDITAPETIAMLGGFTLRCAFGNMDFQQDALGQAIRRLGQNNRAGLVLELDFNGMAVAVAHGHQREVLSNLIHSGRYAYVFHGHTHRRRDERIGGTRVINPGALSGARSGGLSIACLNLAEDDLRFFELPHN